MKLDYYIIQKIKKYGVTVLFTPEFMQTSEFLQHGDTTVFLHCIAVAYISLKIVKRFNLKVNKNELVRSALLHDYFLYDWHDGRIKENKIHGFHHPKVAMNNAIRDFNINENEQDNIKKHMWPLTIIPPTKKEGWVITISDKICATYETFHRKSSMISMDDLQLDENIAC